MSHSKFIYFLIDKQHIKFPGFSIITTHIENLIPEAKIVYTLNGLKITDTIIPLGIVSAIKVLNSKFLAEVAFIVDPPTLAMKGGLSFYFSQGEYFTKRNLIYLLKYIKYAILEFRVIRKYKKIIVVSNHDQIYLKNRYLTDKIEVVTNGVDLPNNDKVVSIKKFDYTIGSLSYWGTGGIDDIDWFVKSYLPKLRAVFPNLKFITAGKGATPLTLSYFEKHNIIHLGEINELNSFFDKVDIMITTKRQECGVLNKILDAFAHKKIVLGYEPNFYAFYPFNDGYFTFKTYEEFIRKFEQIRLNPIIVHEMTEKSYQYIIEKHSWELNYKRLLNIIIANSSFYN
jgi:glycosyltransferase involved in cell wall biosynthesis